MNQSASSNAVAVVLRKPYETVASVGHFASFVVKAIGSVPYTLRNYRHEIIRMLSDITWGNGAIVVGGGTVVIMILLGLSTGAAVGIEGFAALDILGMAPLTGFVSAYANTREIAPLIAAIAFAAQAGCRYTAQLGAMRISEEIDALDSMAVRPIPYLVTTRIIAALTAILPLYLVALAANYFSTAWVLNVFYGQSTGTYLHYFHAFLIPADVFVSVLKAAVFIVIATLVHCYFGYYASGGPQGVGQASGRAIRASLIAIVVASMLITMAFWGFDPGIRIAG